MYRHMLEVVISNVILVEMTSRIITNDGWSSNNELYR